MQPIPNRHISRLERFPTRMSVEVGEGDARESFEADVLDFTRAGASMRASRLPEIGTQLECGFRCGVHGTMVRARAEVVWAEAPDESCGEFGLAFTGLDPDAREVIEELFSQPLARREADAARDAEAMDEAIARLELEGSTEPISARVAHREPRSAIFEQQLELLSLGRGVRAQAPGAEDCHGSIAGVGLRMVGDVPMLAVTVRFDESRDRAADDEAEDSVDPNIPHDTVADLTSPLFAASSAGEHGPQAVTISDGRLAPPETGGDEFAVAIDEALPAAIDAVSGLETSQPAVAEASSSAAHSELWAALAPRVSAARQTVSRSVDAVRALLLEWRTEARASFDGRFAQTGGRLRDAYHAQVGSRVGAVRRLVGTRRRTASTHNKPVEASSRRFLVGAGVATAALVGVVIYALNGSAPEALPADPSAATQTAVLPAVGVGASRDGAGEAQQAPRETAQPQRPSPAVARPARRRPNLAAGDDLPPDAVAEGAPSIDVAPTATPAEDSKAAHPNGRAAKPRFGEQDLPHAARFSIRMAAPIASLEGVSRNDGFSVTIIGAQALDRAAPLVKRFPGLVSTAKIRNRAGHAELELKFVSGKRPLYQVTADGSWLRIAMRDK